jgi:hypothetical protein
MRIAARLISTLFHPLLMPTLGLLLILNSGTYLSLLDPAAKRAILYVMALGTFVFPLMMVPVLHYRNLGSSFKENSLEEKLLPHLIILILYVITFVYFVRLPLSKIFHAYLLSVPITMFSVLIISLKFKISRHMTALGAITGLVLSLVMRYETPLEGILMLTLLASGLTGTSRLYLGVERPVEICAGYLLGGMVVIVTLVAY